MNVDIKVEITRPNIHKVRQSSIWGQNKKVVEIDEQQL